jgi:glycosyltransferase involved in cell wall biosynthesis
MKILHLYSDWKWTGPAEPVLHTCLALQARGHDVLLAYRAQPQFDEESVGIKVREMGVNGTEQFALDRYFHIRGTLHDLCALPGFIRRQAFDVVHTHLSHDHAMGGLCVKRLGRQRPVIVRTLHQRSVLKPSLGARLLLRRFSDGCLVFTEGFRQEYAKRFRIAPERIGVMPMPVDLARYDAKRHFQDMRQVFGIAPDAPLIGIVGRFQRYRRMDVFLEAARRVVTEAPSTRFLVIGRSGQIRETVVKPVAQLGLQDHVVLAGYRTADYADTLACLDVFSLLMPGFDGTARALREALALGKPAVVSDFGMLPDIVRHGNTGLVTPAGDADALARAWLELIRAPDRRRAMGEAARRDATARFRADLIAPCLDTFYQSLIARRTQSHTVQRGPQP